MFGGETSKDVEVVVDSPAALTLIRPEPAPGGTVARISVEEMMRKRADIAPNRTADAVPNHRWPECSTIAALTVPSGNPSAVE